MSIDKKILKLQHEQCIFKLLEFLLDNEYIESESSAAGITKKILTEKSFENLSAKQLNRFNEDVLPLIEVECKECGRALDVSEALEAYQNDNGNGDLFCLSCFDELR